MTPNAIHPATGAWRTSFDEAPSCNPFFNPACQWEEHEHLADVVRIQARRLVDEAGTAELAKQAIDTVALDQEADQDAFARQFGFESYRVMAELSEPVVSSDGAAWRVIAGANDEWIMWRADDLSVHERSETRDKPHPRFSKNRT